MSAQKKEIKSWKWENMDLVLTFYKITNLLLAKCLNCFVIQCKQLTKMRRKSDHSSLPLLLPAPMPALSAPANLYSPAFTSRIRLNLKWSSNETTILLFDKQLTSCMSNQTHTFILFSWKPYTQLILKFLKIQKGVAIWSQFVKLCQWMPSQNIWFPDSCFKVMLSNVCISCCLFGWCILFLGTDPMHTKYTFLTMSYQRVWQFHTLWNTSSCKKISSGSNNV